MFYLSLEPFHFLPQLYWVTLWWSLELWCEWFFYGELPNTDWHVHLGWLLWRFYKYCLKSVQEKLIKKCLAGILLLTFRSWVSIIHMLEMICAYDRCCQNVFYGGLGLCLEYMKIIHEQKPDLSTPQLLWLEVAPNCQW